MQVSYVDHMGDDLSVVNAARVSFDKVSDWAPESECPTDPITGGKIPPYKRLKEEDSRLINYLAKHDHWTPFAHTTISLRMQAPVPIRTQCFKHKAGFVENEESRRYISKAPELFVPVNFREKPEGSIKQGSGEIHRDSDLWLIRYTTHCRKMIELYEWAIEDGVCPEQARFMLPQGVEVQWIWTGNLASYARFYNLRTDPHAQKETQELARMVGDIIQPLFPVSWNALTKGNINNG